jgi:hypothetical protein
VTLQARSVTDTSSWRADQNTSSAWKWREGKMVRPKVWEVLRVIPNAKLDRRFLLRCPWCHAVPEPGAASVTQAFSRAKPL